MMIGDISILFLVYIYVYSILCIVCAVLCLGYNCLQRSLFCLRCSLSELHLSTLISSQRDHAVSVAWLLGSAVTLGVLIAEERRALFRLLRSGGGDQTFLQFT